MKTELIQKILWTEPQVRQLDEGIYQCGDELEVTALFDMGHETLTINRVRKLSFLAEYLSVETYRGERFYVGADTPMRGIKFAEPENKKVRGAGLPLLT